MVAFALAVHANELTFSRGLVLQVIGPTNDGILTKRMRYCSSIRDGHGAADSFRECMSRCKVPLLRAAAHQVLRDAIAAKGPVL